MLYVCGDQPIYMPEIECDNCEGLSERLRAVEQQLAGKGDVVISKTDERGNKVTVTLLGNVE